MPTLAVSYVAGERRENPRLRDSLLVYSEWKEGCLFWEEDVLFHLSVLLTEEKTHTPVHGPGKE